MSSTNPANTSFSDLLVRVVVETDPLEMGEFPPELEYRPNHGHTWLGDNCPPMFFTLLLLFNTDFVFINTDFPGRLAPILFFLASIFLVH